VKRAEPWWVCLTCGEAVTKVGKSFNENHLQHVKKCPKAGYRIRQIEQRKRA
jgi:hypothetical protein